MDHLNKIMNDNAVLISVKLHILLLTPDSDYFCVRWLNPLFRIGRKRKLEEDDMYEVLTEDRSEKLGQDLQRYIEGDLQNHLSACE